MIGQIISHYKILEKLGEGGMGVVYKAEDTKLKRTVALKFLPPELTRDPEAKERFLHEAQAAAALSHPNICTIYEINESESQPFLAMECIEGQTLKDKIEDGPLKMSMAMDIVTQVGEGLHEAHEKGIVHRDIKPANIMITGKGQAKIMDFGLAKLRGRTKLTVEGTTLGTVSYMSPEQARGEEVDHRTDIWSLGVILFEMITGQLPFHGDYEQAVMYSIINEAPEPITGLRTGLSLELERIVNKTLAKNPGERYQHVNEMLVDIGSIERVEESRRTKTKPVVSKRPISKMVYLILGLLLIFTVIVVGRLYLFKGGIEYEAIDSIAVLPLENLSGDPEQEYFTDGMTEALITDLSKITSLKVISRTSAMRYKKTEKSIPEIAQELNVDVLVEGSVMKVGEQVRITAQLIHGATDEHLWAENYDRDLENVLGLLTEVAKTIAGEIEVALTQREQENLGETHPVNPEAYEVYLKGRYFFSKITDDGIRKSLEYYQKAIDIDSSFALGWSGLAATLTLMAGFGMTPVDEALPQGKAAALKAVELDDRIAAAHNSLGWARLYSWDWEGAKESFQIALELNPNSATACHGYCDYLTVMGHLEEGLEYVIRGRESDPFSVIANIPVVGHLFICRRYDEAIKESHRLFELFPNQSIIRAFLRNSYWKKGMYEEALEELRKGWVGRDSELLEAVERGIAESGPRGAMRAVAEKLALDSKTEYIDPIDVAVWYARAGETEPTIEWLERACDQRSPLLWHSIVYPDFDHLREDPRYKAIIKKMGLKI